MTTGYAPVGDATGADLAREDARNRMNGQFGHQHRAEAPGVDPKEHGVKDGSWYYPASFKTTQEYIEFWSEIPIPDEALARFETAYERNRTDDMAPSIPRVAIRTVARATMMHTYAGVGGVDRDSVLAHRVELGSGDVRPTILQVVEHFKTADIWESLGSPAPDRSDEELAERRADRALREREIALQEQELELQKQLLEQQVVANRLLDETRIATAQTANANLREATGKREYLQNVDQVARHNN